MNTSQRTASHHKRQMLHILSNPVAKACRRAKAARANAEFHSQLLDTRLKLLSADDGTDATELLACLAVVIGTPCEAGARQFGHAVPWVRQLHGALRTIQAICLDGYKWQAKFALALDQALEISGEHCDDLDLRTYQDSYLEASALAACILAHTVAVDSVAQVVSA